MQNTEEEQTSNAIESPPARSLDQLIADQRLMLGLLQRRFEPLSDIPKIAEKIWNSTDDAWAGSEEASQAPGDRSLGTEFLSTLEPCGTSVTGSDGAMNQNSNKKVRKWISEDNLVIARRTLEKWIRNPGLRYSSPWEEGFSSKSLEDRETDRERRISRVFGVWPKTWEPLQYLPFRAQPNSMYRNEINVYYTWPISNNISDAIQCVPFQKIHVDMLQRLREENSINGIICQVSLGLYDGIIDFETMATILCLSNSNEFLFQNTQHEFLDAHASEWRERFIAERIGTRKFQSSRHLIAPPSQAPGLHSYGVSMHYMRSFTVSALKNVSGWKGTPSDGLKCKRESIRFKAFYNEHAQTLVERRYSTALSFFPIQHPGGHFALLSLIDVDEYLYHEWDNSATDHRDRLTGWKYGIYPAGLYTGVSLFQLEICSFIEEWEKDWSNTITEINKMTSVQLDILNNDRRLRELVLDTNPDDLVLYFKVLQMLGRFSEVITADVARLESLSTNFFIHTRSNCWWQDSYKHNEDTKRVLEYNWDIVRKRQQQAADNVSTQIKQTKEEVRGLIDGLYNVQSVTEAQKSRTLNKYLMVFTIVTVIFLPPSFAATFFGMDAFQLSDNASTRKTFWTVLGILSGLTYIIAGIGLFGANTSVRIKLEYAKRSKSKVTGIGKATNEKKAGFGIKKTNPWFGKIKQIWMKSPNEARGSVVNTQGDGHSGQSDAPPV